jgi:hypothetical protein
VKWIFGFLALAVVAGLGSWAIITFKPSSSSDAATVPTPIRDYVNWLALSGCGGELPGCVVSTARRLTSTLYVVRFGTSAGTCFNVAPGIQSGKFAGWNHDGLTVFGVGYRC